MSEQATFDNYQVVAQEGELAVVYAYDDGKSDDGKYGAMLLQPGEPSVMTIAPIMERIEWCREAGVFAVEFINNYGRRQARFVLPDGSLAGKVVYDCILGFRDGLCIVKANGLENFVGTDLKEVGPWRFLYLTYPDGHGLMTAVYFDKEIRACRIMDAKWHADSRRIELIGDQNREGVVT